MLIPMSTASTDRDGESIDPLGWRKSLPAFRKRPVLLSSHNYGDLRKQIGEFTKVKVSEDGLFASPRYYIGEGNEEADWAFKLASKGMAAYSVGFIPKAWTDGDGEKTPLRTYTEQELLEISHVVVPSNRDAIQGVRGKSADPAINQLVEDIINAEIIDLTVKPEDTGDTIRIPVDDGDHSKHKMRTIEISKKEGIQALYCIDDKLILTYLFDKAMGWTMEKAKAWVKDHEKSVIVATLTDTNNDTETVTAAVVTEEIVINSPRVHSQQEISDELDYIRTLAQENGLSGDNLKLLREIAQEIARTPASDMAADDKIKRIINQTVSHVINHI
jgi:HK97 family phage prohead protease